MPNNLKGATKKSIQAGKVAQLDGIGSSSGDFTEVLSVIEDVVAQFIDRVQENINGEKGMVTTGAINDIKIQAVDNTVQVVANPHLVYQDRGVNGSEKKLYDTPHQYTDKKPPVQVFIDWIKEKNIQLVNNEKYDKEGGSPFKELTQDQLINRAAWGMVNKVYKEGFKPRNIYSKEIPKLIEDLQQQVKDFAVQQIIQNIDLINPATNRIIIK